MSKLASITYIFFYLYIFIYNSIVTMGKREFDPQIFLLKTPEGAS